MSKKRSIPDWMKTTVLADLADIKDKSEIDENEPTPKRRLRSNFTYEEKENKVEIIKPIDYPPITYNGKIHYYTTMMDIACACDELLTWLNKHPDEIVPIAFDMEWPFSFQTGPGKSSVIQLCAETHTCYVFHLTDVKKLPVALLELLTHKKVKMHGVNIKNDFRKLERDFPEAKSQEMIDRCIDLGPWCNDVLDTSGRWSLERLVKEVCKLKIDKNKAVRMSKWHVVPLNDIQKMYAAIDVYISQVIYYELQKREQEKENAIKEFVEEYGEVALNVVKSLN